LPPSIAVSAPSIGWAAITPSWCPIGCDLSNSTRCTSVLASHDGAVSLRGAAGTGKTATLQELHRGLAESGRDVLAVAPTRSAVNELQHVGFSEAMTIQRLLVDPQEQAHLRDRVLIVDEAGMVSARQMTALLALAEHQAARVVFSGDTRQLQSVEAGDALRILERESGLRSVSLTQVQRQTAETYRQAIEALREHPRAGLNSLNSWARSGRWRG
jgi:ATP-dependent exoDNAse (exonuclease V) alpha subunit